MPPGTTKGPYSKAVFVKNWVFWCSLLMIAASMGIGILWVYLMANNLLGILGQSMSGVTCLGGPILSLVCFGLFRILIDYVQVDHILYEDPELTRSIKY